MIGRITETEIPKTLYKYRDWSNKYHRRLISKQEIYFPRPSEFNDPFDGNIPVRWDLMTYEDCYQRNLELINTVHKDKDQKAVRAYVKKITDGKQLWHPDRLAKERPEQIKKWDSIIGLLSLSAVPDNILMWSHYAYNHTGFVVGLDTASISSKYEFDYLEPIVYQKEYPIISGNDEQTANFYRKFFHKSELWEYEKEWRISKSHIPNRKVKLKKESIKEVIIGCCAAISQEREIVKLVKRKLGNDFPILKASKSDNEFAIKITQIE